MTHEIVVASHAEDLTWVKFWNAGNRETQILPDSKVTIYQAGRDLPNRGREAGQWIHHIIKNYNSLSDYTFFVQADLGAGFGARMGIWPNDLNAFRGFRPPSGSGFFIWPSHNPVTIPSRPTRLCCGDGTKFKRLWGFEPDQFSWPDVFSMAFLGAQHVVSSDIIRALPREYYEGILAECDDQMAFWLEYGKWPAVIYDIFRQGPLRTPSV